MLSGRSELGLEDDALPPIPPMAPLSMPMSSLASNIEGATAPESEHDQVDAGPGIWTTPTQAEVSWDEDDDRPAKTGGFFAWLFSRLRN